MAESKREAFSNHCNNIAKLGKAFSHPARIIILQMLAQNDDCVGDIVKVLPLAQSTVSQHIKELKNIGILKSKTEDNRIFYCIDKNQLSEFYNTFCTEIEAML